MDSIAQLEAEGRYEELIRLVREGIAADATALGDADVKGWCTRRWLNLFLQEAVKDERALDVATRWQALDLDTRSDGQRIAERYLKGEARAAWRTDMPPGFSGRVPNTTIIFCPGLANGSVPKEAFDPALWHAEERFGLRALRAECHPMRGCRENADDVLRTVRLGRGRDAAGHAIEAADATPPEGGLVFIGYSKGMPDAMTFIARYPEYAPRTRVVFGWGGAAGGTPMADLALQLAKALRVKEGVTDASRFREMLNRVLPAKLDPRMPLSRLDEFNIVAAFNELTPSFRQAFLEEHRAFFEEAKIPFFWVTGATHLWDAPYAQIPLYLRLKRNAPMNDMQLTTLDTRVPYTMATELAIINAHHWDMSFGPFVKSRKRINHLYHPFPTEAGTMAMVQLVAELGLID